MKRVLTVLMIVLAFLAPVHIPEERESNVRPMEEGSKQAGGIRREAFQNASLDRLVEEFCFPDRIYEGLKHGTDMGAFPPDIVNGFGEALHGDTVLELLASMNNEELMITAEDFIFHPYMGDDVSYHERLLNEVMSEGASGVEFYKCDVSGDRTEEIIAHGGKDALKGEGYIFLLKSLDDGYVYAGFDYIGSHSGTAIFKYESIPYMAVSYDRDKTTAETIGLFSLSGEGENGWSITKECLYLQRKYTGCNSYVLYESVDSPLAKRVCAYAEEICADLIFADRMDACFVGDEAKSTGLAENAWENNEELKFRDIFAVDIDNDGLEEYFTRDIHKHDRYDSRISWYDPETWTVCAPPLNVWTPTGFYASQMWVRIMEGKTVAFFLYQKEQEDIYLLDARICEEGRTTPLLDLMIDLQCIVDTSNQRDYVDFFEERTDYYDPDHDKAFPGDLTETAKRLSARVQGPFQAVQFEQENVPAELIVGLERALFWETPDLEGVGIMMPEADPDVFFDLTDAEDREVFYRYNNHIYEFAMDDGDYYLTVTDSGGTAGFAYISMYRKENGVLTEVFDTSTLDMDARVLQYGGEKYLVERYYNYYSKYGDTCYIGRLTPNGIGDYVRITFLPEEFIWEKRYDAGIACSGKISAYVDSVKEELMAASPITDDIRVFMGDESSDIGHEELLRLRSLTGGTEFDWIDMDNDGEEEYLERHHWFPSNSTLLHLVANVFQISEGRTKRMNFEFDEGRETLLQLWFKEFEGKVFTFRLYLINGYNYLLNVSLIEGTEITQVQSYIIVPKRSFAIKSEKKQPGGWG